MATSIQAHYISSNSHCEKERLICVVCGSIARGRNFGAITCMSCKVFFRRNAFTNLTDLYCRDEGNCEITEQTRKHCVYCRLLTCFRVGMKKELFRIKEDNDFNRIKIEKQKYRKQLKLPSHSYEITSNNQHMSTTNSTFIRSLDLLQWADRSQLSNNDWSLLRQISSIFDSLTGHVISKAYQIHHQLSFIGIQPLKMRVKASYIYDLGNSFNNTALKFIKSIPQFILLPSLNKQTLLLRNTRPVITFYSYYHLNLQPVQTLTQTSYWITSMECLFIPSIRHLHDEISHLVGHISFIDPCLIKLILVILAFSTNNIDYDHIIMTHQLDEYYHTFILHKIQNIYIELMWKYMIHRFGEQRAISLFSDIIKTILRVQVFVFVMENSKTSFEQKFYGNLVKSIDETL